MHFSAAGVLLLLLGYHQAGQEKSSPALVFNFGRLALNFFVLHSVTVFSSARSYALSLKDWLLLFFFDIMLRRAGYDETCYDGLHC